MISASTANFESKNMHEIKAIEKELEDSIREAIEKGSFYCEVSIGLSTSKEVRNRIKEDMSKLGYKIDISDAKANETNCPVDQCSYYDIIALNWGDDYVRF